MALSPVVGAVEPSLQVGKQDMDDRHGPLGVLAFALDDGVVPIGAVKSGVTLEIVADEASSRPNRGAHEAAQLNPPQAPGDALSLHLRREHNKNIRLFPALTG